MTILYLPEVLFFLMPLALIFLMFYCCIMVANGLSRHRGHLSFYVLGSCDLTKWFLWLLSFHHKDPDGYHIWAVMW